MHKKTSHDVRRNKELFIKNTTTKRTCTASEEVSYPQLFNLLAPDQRWDVWKQRKRASLVEILVLIRNQPTRKESYVLVF